MPGVIAHNLFHRVGDMRTRVDVLRDVSLEAPAGRLTAVVGPSGAGKTSLLHVLAGLDRPAGGTLCVDERPLSGLDELELTRLRRERIGLLLPAASVLPTITVRENVALPLLIARREHDAATIDALLERVGLSAHRDDRAGELTPPSGSGPRWRARSPAAPRSSWPTSRPATSTRPRAPRCSSCCATSRTRTASRSCSSRATPRLRPRSPTASSSSTAAASSSLLRRRSRRSWHDPAS